MGGGDTEKAFEKVCDLIFPFEKAEAALKSTELAEGDLALVPVNQIRYGFKHLTQALKAYKAGDQAGFDTNIAKALGHCKRSYYDARDAEISFHLGEFQEFQQSARTKGIVISEIVPEYGAWFSTATEVKRFLEVAPTVIEDKDERYEKIEELLTRMRLISDALPGALEIVNQKLAYQRALQEENERLAADAKENARVAKSSLIVSKRSLWLGVIGIGAAVLISMFDEPIKAFGKQLLNPQPAASAPSSGK